MNYPNDFEDRQENREEATQEQNEFNDPRTEGEWYGVSYQNGERPPITLPFDEGARGRKKVKRVVLVAVCVTIFLSLLFLAAFGGAMLSDLLYDNGGGSPLLNNANTSAQGGTGSGSVYGEQGGQEYNYAAVTIPKNDGSGLLGSENGSAGDNKRSVIAVAEAVLDSVVEITTTVNSYRGTITAGAGSGVIIHEDGIIVTNNHVVEGCDTIYVRLTNGNTYEAFLRGVDEDGDIALLKIAPRETLTVAKLGNSGALRVGEEVVAIGNPLGQLGGTVTNGIISALERQVLIEGVTMTLLQTNAAINSGNSGGGLFNMAGELIGIVNAKYSASGVEGLGFAIPIDTACVSINHLLTLGYIPGIPSLGISVEEKNVQTGYFTYRVMLYAYDVGESTIFRQGDYILAVDGTSVSDTATLKQILRDRRVGDEIKVVVLRDGSQQLELTVTLVEYVP